ncbi:tRNA (adenosine(37)-N6)-threonylcarbamoyltransferase complex ATPase subunit type 1 TsaE [Starkeya sp. ORNL1]|uniref:tRNA (adenosine(37)-N6)-threonylcarbamoyltransferase complex ATPase subunit type 1 TsaE n=1 Tax=Starkeya sp. ORNL1 TaxID=2709380 RepID=UPI0014631BAB|nr:tRNA (adenosine(37)-N6)-threonylcarbamoyltransferase complex ATPase subunit type 1 TsaE [Starkeya sp. ORNL1]QJP15210.1 tRNA (adenosine(37)-N6)-threonylcarbamoyltransferase complex ATPase subunit type 1 TsaE [Starkeya sp. ORNL1]
MNEAATVNVTSWDVVLPDEGATSRLAMDLASMLMPGDMVALSGELGTGKTTIARALVREIAADERLDVPSPTFTILQLYELPRARLVHADLYRVADPSELEEIGWDELRDGAITLVEWPDRAGGAALAPDRLDISLSMPPGAAPTVRRVRLIGHGRLATALMRMRATRALIDLAGFGPARRRHLQGDASSRTYERLVGTRRTAVLMDAPRRPDGPPVRDGLPYSAIAHLAEDVRPFVAMARGLKARGFSAPVVNAADLEAGLLVIEDFGTGAVVEGTPPAPVAERYEAATDVLAALHRLDLPATLPVAPNIEHTLPPYDIGAFLIEAELLVDWYLPHQGLPPTSPEQRELFRSLWTEALSGPMAMKPVWTLRDFHSPNLMWLPEREGLARVGLLDFQDALMGPPAYDLVSLAQDARIDVPEELELSLVGRYAKARREADPHFDVRGFAGSYAILGAQRATKILGIFARLDKRDRKPHYLRHMPRIWSYLDRCLAFPDLAGLKAWYETHVPPPSLPTPSLTSPDMSPNLPPPTLSPPDPPEPEPGSPPAEPAGEAASAPSSTPETSAS